MAMDFTMDFEEALSNYSSASDEAEAAVVAMGLGHSQRPSTRGGEPANMPDLPDLSECSPAELAHLISVFTGWHNYAHGRLVYFQKIRDVEAAKREFAWSYLRKHKDGTVADKDDLVRTDSRYVEINRQYMYADNIVRDLSCITESLERNVKTTSRVIEVMKQRLEVEGFGAQMDRKKQNTKSDVLQHFTRGKAR